MPVSSITRAVLQIPYGRERYQGEFEKTFLKGRSHQLRPFFFQTRCLSSLYATQKNRLPHLGRRLYAHGDAKNGQSKCVEEYEDDEKED